MSAASGDAPSNSAKIAARIEARAFAALSGV